MAGKPVTHPAYVVYDLFCRRWDLDWDMLFEKGLGRINHANLLEYEFPIDGIDSLTPPPEGDMTLVAARTTWTEAIPWHAPQT